MKYRIAYRTDTAPATHIEADFLKYDSGIIMFIREVDGKSRVVAVVNAEAIREVVEE